MKTWCKIKILVFLLIVALLGSLLTACSTPSSTKGEQGPSAYEIWLETGHVGTEEDFLNWLKGQKGDKGDKGDQGIQGEQGVGIKSIIVNEKGELIVTLTDDTILPPIIIPNVSVDKSFEYLQYQKISGKDEYKVVGIGLNAKSNIVIPDVYDGLPITEICDSAFENLTHIESVKIGENVNTIGSFAFAGCENLKSVVIPRSVKNIGEFAFACFNNENYFSNLTDVYYTGTIDEWVQISFDDEFANPLLGGENLGELNSLPIKNFIIDGEIVTEVIITSGEISDFSFVAYKNLTALQITDNVSSIGCGAFALCSSLTSVEILNSVTSIGDYAFSGCSSLTSIEIPNSVTSIGARAFDDCESLQYNVKDSLKYLGNETNPYLYLSGVTSQDITSANIDNSCKFIGDSAFFDCSSLTSIVIPDSITSIGQSAFFNCSSLTSIVIPDSVTSIDSSTFRGCSSLTSIVIPEGVTSIGNYAFYGCKSLTSIEIPNSVTSIGNYAFQICSSLTSVVIPDSVTSIGDWVFSGCSSLTSVVIPDSVTSIGYYAFEYCSSLTSIKYRGSEEEWNAISKGYGWNYNTGNYTITYNYNE